MKVLISGIIFILLLCTTAFAGTVNLTWTASTGATGYKLYQMKGTSPTPATDTVITTFGVVTSGSVTSVTPGAYSYYMTAFNTAGESSASNVVTTPAVASVPSGLSASVSNGNVNLTWTANSTNESATYNLYDNGVKLQSNLLTNADIIVYDGKAHSYTVTAVNGWGESAQSNPTIVVAIPSPVTGLTISIVTQ